jgi:hypothetical protein
MYKNTKYVIVSRNSIYTYCFFSWSNDYSLIAKTILKLDGFIQRNKITYWSCLVIGVVAAGSIYISIS